MSDEIGKWPVAASIVIGMRLGGFQGIVRDPPILMFAQARRQVCDWQTKSTQPVTVSVPFGFDESVAL